MKYIWIIYFVNEVEVSAAETSRVANQIMAEYIKNLGELNIPSETNPSIIAREEALNMLAEDYADAIQNKYDQFGVPDICHAELIPFYSSFKEI